MDDIFSDPKDDAEKEGDSNIEWKKSGIDKHERLTLKINVREANLYNAAKANDLKAKNKARTPLDVPKGFKKVSRKIRDSMDEEEDEDDYILVPVFEDMRESSLMRALSEEEKKILQQNENINNVRLQENVGREAAIERAEKVVMQAGLGRADARVLNEERLKAGKVSVDEVVAEAVKQKAAKKSRTETKNPRKEERRARTATKEIAQSRDEESKKAARRLNEAEAGAETKLAAEKKREAEQKAEIKPEEAKPAPENAKNEEIVKTELSSVKADEKAAVERPEPEIAAVREEKTEPAKETGDKVNEDEINKTEPRKEEPEKENPAAEEKMKERPAEAVRETREAAARNEEIVKENAREIVEEKAQEKPQPNSGADKKKDKEVKEMIMEKSGRTYNDRRPQKQIDKTRLSEKEYQKALEAQIKMYQDRER